MNYHSELEPAIFQERPNRFLGVVEHRGERKLCFIPNPGRMNELLEPGRIVYLTRNLGVNRKTCFDMVLVRYEDTLVSIDSRMPNKLLVEAIRSNLLPDFRGFRVTKTEPVYGDSRFDILLSRMDEQVLVEAKSCTLVENGVALFPDAPTKRGARHLRTLKDACKVGRSSIIFVIQRCDALLLRPNESTDPNFAYALRDAMDNGVEAYAYLTDVQLSSITLDGSIPITL
jgi:sugar fermentation stimulation protein A